MTHVMITMFVCLIISSEGQAQRELPKMGPILPPAPIPDQMGRPPVGRGWGNSWLPARWQPTDALGQRGRRGG